MQRGQVLSQQLEDKIRNLRPVPSLPDVTPATKRQEQKVDKMHSDHKSKFISERRMDPRLDEGWKWCIQGDEFGVRVYIQEGADVDMRDPLHGRALIHHATAHGHLHLVRYLIKETNLDINRTTLLGSSTALHIAAQRQSRQILFHLLLGGADPDMTDSANNTALHYVRKRSGVAVLMKFHANPLIRNKSGKLPLDALIDEGAEDTAVHELSLVTNEAWKHRLINIRSSRASETSQSPDTEAQPPQGYLQIC